MSSYKDLTNEFPKRLKEIKEVCLPHLNGKAIDTENRDVSFLIALITTTLAIPMDKIKKDGKEHGYSKIKDKVLKDSFFKELDLEKISFGYEKNPEYNTPEEWSNSDKKGTLTVESFLSIMRNAVAHGNLYFTEESDNINKIAFVSENRTKQSSKCHECNIKPPNEKDEDKPYKFLIFEITEIEKFLDAWINFLSN